MLAAALCAYLVAALCYVFVTPLWQAPDEPAHCNYVRYLATTWRLPVLHEGDYPSDYLEQLKASGFPPDLSIEPIRYESHQPPLYYAVAAAWLAPLAGAPLACQVYALRLLSVAIGAACLLLTYCLGRRLWPRSPAKGAALATVASLVPMHTSVMATTNNDGLAEALVLAAVLSSLRLCSAPLDVLARRLTGPRHHRWLWLPREALLAGLALGLCLVTKMTAFIAAPLVLACIAAGCRRLALPPRAASRALLAAAIPAILLGGLWLGRNAATYGISDPLGQVRHDSVVVGQLRTTERLAAIGLPALLREGVTTTFRSFWGVFGWMGVPMHEQVYALLALVCLIAATGLAAALTHASDRSQFSLRHCLLLFAWALLSTASLFWYNLKFVQYQGRYLFVAMAVWAAALVEGLQRTARHGRLVAGVLLTLALVAVVRGVAIGDIPGLAMAVLVAAAAAVLAWRSLWGRHCGLAASLPLGALWLLSMAGALYYVRLYL